MFYLLCLEDRDEWGFRVVFITTFFFINIKTVLYTAPGIKTFLKIVRLDREKFMKEASPEFDLEREVWSLR